MSPGIYSFRQGFHSGFTLMEGVITRSSKVAIFRQ